MIEVLNYKPCRRETIKTWKQGTRGPVLHVAHKLEKCIRFYCFHNLAIFFIFKKMSWVSIWNQRINTKYLLSDEAGRTLMFIFWASNFCDQLVTLLFEHSKTNQNSFKTIPGDPPSQIEFFNSYICNSFNRLPGTHFYYGSGTGVRGFYGQGVFWKPLADQLWHQQKITKVEKERIQRLVHFCSLWVEFWF